MKTLYNTLKIFAGIILLAILAVSCIPEQQSMGGAGQTLVKMTPDGFKAIPLDAVATTQKALVAIVRKDASNENDLNATTTVVVKKDDAILTKYNTDNGTTFIPLPTSLGTTNPAPAADGTITMQFAGEAAKEIILTVTNATLFDFSKSYALAYRLESVSGIGTHSAVEGDTIVVQVMVKNQWDGLYNSTGSFNHPASGGEGWLWDDTYDRYFDYSGVDAKEGITASANSIYSWAGDVGYDMELTILSTTINVGGKLYPQVRVDILTRPDYGMFTVTEEPQEVGLPCNYYNTDTKTFVLFYYYGSAPNRRKIYEEQAYKGPR